MRIALVTTSFPADEGDPSGHFVRAEARELERAGHEVIVVTPPAGGAFGWPGVAARLAENPVRIVGAAHDRLPRSDVEADADPPLGVRGTVRDVREGAPFDPAGL